MTEAFLGVDVGSVGTKVVLVAPEEAPLARRYVRTNADPLTAIRRGVEEILREDHRILGVGVTGSGKELAGMVVGADVIKNEISSHAVAALEACPEARTVVEIGGQDSKLIVLRDGLIEDFAMNSVCAAGTGSFLEQQAHRLSLSLDELSEIALEATQEVPIAGRCTVFAESDMIYKQQLGHPRADIVYGLCTSLARNYLNTLCKGKRLEGPVVFQGGVAANRGMRRAFERILEAELIIPDDFFFMGAIGAAIFAARDKPHYGETSFSVEALARDLEIESQLCEDCEQRCSVLHYVRDDETLGYRGDACGKYSLPGGKTPNNP